MTNNLLHLAEEIIREYLIDAGVVSRPGDDLTWPCFVGSEPNSPDNVVTIFGTTNVPQGRTFDGELQEQYGFQVRIRAKTFPVGRTKSLAIRQALINAAHVSVVLDESEYVIQNFSRVRNVMSLGRDGKSSAREIMVINATFAVNSFEYDTTPTNTLLDQSDNYLTDDQGNTLQGVA